MDSLEILISHASIEVISHLAQEISVRSVNKNLNYKAL